ncbi:MAG: type II secretion system protein N [Xanthomonadales bacterium]|nr:type II secretion system protein N [Xanthomonadales bacterium]
MMSPAWSSRLALISSAILALAVVWLAVRAFWLVIGGVSVDSAPALPVPRMSESGGSSGEFRWNLFGRSSAPAVRLQPVPVSDSRLRLKGVMAGERGYAIIAVSGSGEDVYRVGDEMPGGGEVEAIESRQVIIRRDGRRETLALDPDSVSAGPRETPTSGNARVAEEPAERLPGIRGFNTSAGASMASLPAAARSFGLDAGELAQSISVMPVSGGGFRVRPGRDARLFGALGLQVNDIVVAVNGQPLESSQAVRGLFGDVMSRGEVSITVRRDGREMTLRPDLEKIMGSLQSQ